MNTRVFGDLSNTRSKPPSVEPNLADKPHLGGIAKVGVKKVAMVAKLATPETEEIFGPGSRI